MAKRSYTDEEIEEALQKAHGLVAVAARRLSMTGKKISRQGLEKVIKNSPRLSAVLEDESKAVLDVAEHKLFELVNAGDKTAIIFLLKTKGKSRGYIERSEMTGADGKPITGDKAVPVEVKINVIRPKKAPVNVETD